MTSRRQARPEPACKSRQQESQGPIEALGERRHRPDRPGPRRNRGTPDQMPQAKGPSPSPSRARRFDAVSRKPSPLPRPSANQSPQKERRVDAAIAGKSRPSTSHLRPASPTDFQDESDSPGSSCIWAALRGKKSTSPARASLAKSRRPIKRLTQQQGPATRQRPREQAVDQARPFGRRECKPRRLQAASGKQPPASQEQDGIAQNPGASRRSRCRQAADKPRERHFGAGNPRGAVCRDARGRSRPSRAAHAADERTGIRAPRTILRPPAPRGMAKEKSLAGPARWTPADPEIPPHGNHDEGRRSKGRGQTGQAGVPTRPRSLGRRPPMTTGRDVSTTRSSPTDPRRSLRTGWRALRGLQQGAPQQAIEA